jgi:hypothetical protein
VTTSRVPALIDYLVAEFTTAATLGAATPAVLVFDGPPTTGDPAPLALYVGVDDAFADTAATSATSEQTATGLAQKREELATIHLAAVAWAGTDDMKTVRASAYSIVGAVEDLVRADTALAGLPGAALARPGVTGIVLQQNNTAQGAVAQVSFQITYRTLIGV